MSAGCRCSDVVQLFGIAANDFAYADAGVTDEDALLNIEALEVAAQKPIQDGIRPNKTSNFGQLLHAFRQMTDEQITSSCPFVLSNGADSRLYEVLYSRGLDIARQAIGGISSVYEPMLTSAVRSVVSW